MAEVISKKFVVLSQMLVQEQKVEIAPDQVMSQLVQVPQFFATADELAKWLDNHFKNYPGDQPTVQLAPVIEAEIEIGFEEIEDTN